MIKKFDKPAKKKSIAKTKVLVSNTVRSYENDPFVVKKSAAAKAVIDRYGFPKELNITK